MRLLQQSCDPRSQSKTNPNITCFLDLEWGWSKHHVTTWPIQVEVLATENWFQMVLEFLRIIYAPNETSGLRRKRPGSCPGSPLCDVASWRLVSMVTHITSNAAQMIWGSQSVTGMFIRNESSLQDVSYAVYILNITFLILTRKSWRLILSFGVLINLRTTHLLIYVQQYIHCHVYTCVNFFY